MRSPTFRELSEAECMTLLGRNHVGRLAFAHDSRVDIEPIHYVSWDGWIFGRTSEGAKLDALKRRPWVAFEVDEVRSIFDWKSIVVHGTIYFLPADGAPIERQEFERAVDMLRAFMPESLTSDDPVPWRTTVFGLHIAQVSGRVAEMKRTHARRSPRTVEQKAGA